MNNAYLPVINVESLIATPSPDKELAAKIRDASREYGFFYVVGHGVDEDLQLRLEQASRDFFDRNLERKREIDMSRGGQAWRGYFPLGGELTSGKPDLKE